MTILFRTQVGIMERRDCEVYGCTNPAAFRWQDAGKADMHACVQHDAQLQRDVIAEGDLMLNITFQEAV